MFDRNTHTPSRVKRVRAARHEKLANAHLRVADHCMKKSDAHKAKAQMIRANMYNDYLDWCESHLELLDPKLREQVKMDIAARKSDKVSTPAPKADPVAA